MNFHTSTLAIGSHRGIQFRQGQINGGRPWKGPANGGHDSASHMLQQLRGLLHLLFHEFMKGRIVQGVSHLVTLHRPLQRITHPQVDVEVTTYPTLLRHHPVESVEADMPQKDVPLSSHYSLIIIHIFVVRHTRDVLFQRTLHTRLPGVDALILQ